MSAEEIYRQQMGELPGEYQQSIPENMLAFRSGVEVPPDLIYRGAGGPAEAGHPSFGTSEINSRNYPDLFRAIRRQGYFITQPFIGGLTIINPRPLESRTYLFIQNIATVGDLYIGFGNEPSAGYGLTLTPGSAYEPFTIPVNEIYILGSVANVAGFLVYSREAG